MIFKALRRLLALLAVVLAGWGLWEWRTWPDVAGMAERNPETTAFIETFARSRGNRVEWRWVPYGQISEHLKHAVVVAEDIEFFQHQGFAVHEIKTAVRDTVKEGKPLRGASTITQQVAKNLWLSPSRNPWRKVKEALLTRQLERSLSKRRILEIYLNVAQMGPDVFGAEAAARRYYGVSATALSPRQAAELAACLSRPSLWGPDRATDGYRRRVRLIEIRMEQAGWVRRHLRGG